MSGDLMGTVLYMSPEQAMAKRIPLDHRADIYSLGATMFETLTFEPPFRGKDQNDTLSRIILHDPPSLRRLNLRVPRDLETIVLKCLRKDPEHRYGTAEALAQDLRRFVRGDPIEARPQSGWERLSSRLRRHKTKLLVAATFLILVFSVAWLAYRTDQAEMEIKTAREETQTAREETQRATYDTTVHDVLKKIYAGQFSHQAVGGKWRRLGDVPDAVET